MLIKRCEPFAVDGTGENAAWREATAYPLTRVGGSSALGTTVQALYSRDGVYVLFRCEAKSICAPVHRDFADLYDQDVTEIFLQPDPGIPCYLEYELSPLGDELPLMVWNRGQGFYGWLPFHYEGDRRVLHAAAVRGGEAAHGAACAEWTAECFIPNALWEGVMIKAPRAGDCWYGNFFRIAFAGADVSRFALEAACGTDFHRPELFTALRFG